MFEFDKIHKQIQRSAKAFAAGEFDKDICREMDSNSQFRENIRLKAGNTGFLGIHFPEEYSGGALGAVEEAILAKTFCRQDSTAGCALMFSTIGSSFLLGSDVSSLKQKYLPELAEGSIISAEAFSEANSDPSFLRIDTIAEKKENGWLINGRKVNVINGVSAGVYFVLCKSEADSLSVFLVDADTEGIVVNEKQETLGLRMIERAGVSFENVLIPAENRLTIISKNKQELKKYAAENQVHIAAIATGIAKGAYDRALKYSKIRDMFGKKLADFQISRHKLADMAIQIELAFLITFKAAAAIENNVLTPSLGAMAKKCATECALNVSDAAVQLLGGYGYTSEYEVERYYRDAKVLELLCGGKSYLKDTIADKEIGRSKKK